MSGFLYGLGQAAGIAGNVIGGMQQDQHDRLTEALLARKQAQDDETARIGNAVKVSETGKNISEARKNTAEAGNLETPAVKLLGHGIGANGVAYQIIEDPTTKKPVWSTVDMSGGGAAPAAPPLAAPDIPTDLAAPKNMTAALQGVPTAKQSVAPKPSMPVVASKPALSPFAKNPAEIVGTPEWQAAEKFRAGLSKPTFKNYVEPNDPTKVHLTTPEKAAEAGWIEQKTGGSTAPAALMVTTMNRLGLSEGDIANAIATMDKNETDPAFLKKLTAYQQTLSAAAQTSPDPHPHGVTGALNNMGGAFLAAEAQKAVDPEIRRYMRNAQIVGTAATEILPRPNQQLLGIERGLSGIDVGWNPEMTKDIQDRRHRMRDMLHASLQSTPLAGKTGGGAAAPPGTADGKPFDINAYINQYPVKPPDE